jgi:hypothetical protein
MDDIITMRFEDALVLLRNGSRISRAHWNGMYLEAPNGGKPFFVMDEDKPDNRSDFAFSSDCIFADDWCEYARKI